jgi:hypothetical protein
VGLPLTVKHWSPYAEVCIGVLADKDYNFVERLVFVSVWGYLRAAFVTRSAERSCRPQTDSGHIRRIEGESSDVCRIAQTLFLAAISIWEAEGEPLC